MTGGGRGKEEGALSRGRPPEGGGGSEDELQGGRGGVRRKRAEKKERNLIRSLEEISLLKYFAQKDIFVAFRLFSAKKGLVPQRSCPIVKTMHDKIYGKEKGPDVLSFGVTTT